MRLSLNRVTPLGARLVTETGADFDELSYSRFKHGDGVLAERYGSALAAALLRAAPEVVKGGEPLVIASAPYKYLPTASHELALHVRRVLNVALAETGRPPASIGGLRMGHVDSQNYATEDVVRRRVLLREAKLSAEGAAFAGRHVLLVDDARITGLAEATAIDLLASAGARLVTTLYAVEISDGLGTSCPDVEHRINHAFVRDLVSLLQVFRAERFVLNIRTLKYILGWPEPNELEAFLGHLTHAELAHVHDSAWKTGPEFACRYIGPLRLVQSALDRHPSEEESAVPQDGRRSRFPDEEACTADLHG
jgi:PRTase ComF-like